MELLVSVAIISILVAIMFPAAQRIMEGSRSAKCAGNLRGIGQAITLYMNENDRLFPKPDRWSYDGWIDELKSYNNGLTDELFHCPDDRLKRDGVGAPRSYAVNYFIVDGANYTGKVIIPKAASKLIVLGERATSLSVIGQAGANDMWWSADITPLHGNKTFANMLYLDGHVDTLKIDFPAQYWGSPFWIESFDQSQL